MIDKARGLQNWFGRIPIEIRVLGGWWLLYAGLDAVTAKALNLQGYPEISWSEAFEYGFARATPATWLGLAFYWLLIRKPVLGSKPGFWHLGVSVLFMVASALLISAFYMWVYKDIVYWRDFLRIAKPSYEQVVAIQSGPAAANALLNIIYAYGFAYYRQAVSRGKALGEMQSALAGARLDALRAQLNPHFLFNALNSIGEAMHHDVASADRMLVSLSTLLRDRLSMEDGAQLRSLGEELALARDYLSIEQVRLGSRLQLGWEAHADALQVKVPVLAVQALVENAVIYALSRTREPGHLRVHAHTEGDRVVIEVGNSLPAAASAVSGTGLGLSSVAQRLQLIYGDAAALTRNEYAGWYWVRLDIPVCVANEGHA